jgi:predicted nucleotidyltransferase
MTKQIILKSLVGSRAHNLHNEDSDFDYRGVYLQPTREILTLGHKYKGTSWIEGEVDDTSYEIGHFLHLCTKANPTVFEVLMSHKKEVESPLSQELVELFPYMYDPKDAFNAFAGYSKNQQKKLLDDHGGRRNKFGVAYMRTAACLIELLDTGTFSLEVKGEARKVLMKCKAGEMSNGHIIDRAEGLIDHARRELPNVENKQDLKKVNDFLLKVRKENW